MSTGYSAHPELASEQLRNARISETAKTKAHRLGSPQHRRQSSAASDARRGFFNFSPFRSKSTVVAKNAELSPHTTDGAMATTTTTTTKTTTTNSNFNSNSSSPQKTLPDRTRIRGYADDDDGAHSVGETEHHDDTKDCVDSAPSGGPRNLSNDDVDEEVDHRLQHQPETSYDRDGGAMPRIAQPSTLPSCSEGCPSGLSSAISSPSASTVSSPLSTPTRLTTQLQHSHQHCCRKSSPLAAILPGVASSAAAAVSHYQHHHLHQHSHQHKHQHQHHHYHHHHHHHHSQHGSSASASSTSTSASASASSVAGGCKKLQKFDPRFGPSPYRQLLPIILCILSFAAVFTILIIYMDTTEIRHQQFRLNMSRDYDLYGVAQDDPTLIAFLREIHMRKYPMHFLKNHADPTMVTATATATAGGAASVSTVSASGTLNFSTHHDGVVPEMGRYVAGLVGDKLNGATIQSLTGGLGQLITAPWLAETLNWAGIIVEPEPRRYFALRKQNDNRARMQVVHACVSPNPYPKEVTIHNEESDVRINSLLDEETSWFNSRVKCFPLYTIMLACNRVEYDLLSLGVHGHELEILQTLPFDKIKIEVISIHLPDNMDKAPRGNIQTITKFLAGKGYKLQKTFGSNYFYQRINMNRTRKKDIFLLKT